MKSEPLTLAIDTSCDETSVSVVLGLKILSNVLPSQTEFHAKYGGIVPSLAKLAHTERIDNVVLEALKRSKKTIEDMDFIAVTEGPGLAIALEVGIKKAKELASEHKKPLIAVNHMIGHMYSFFAKAKKIKNVGIVDSATLKQKLKIIQFPALAFLISGKHTEIVLVEGIGKYKKVGETLDDACGEAYDKCGRILGFGYPGGPVVADFAKKNKKNVEVRVIKNNQSTLISVRNINSHEEYKLPIAMANSGDLNFSFSGLKTAFKQLVDKYESLEKGQIMDLCSTFEAAALTQLTIKLDLAIKKYQPKEVWLGGGVVANAALRSELRKVCRENKVLMRFPVGRKLTTDNAAMIGIAANILIDELGGVDEVKSKIKDQRLKMEEKGIYSDNFEKIDRKPSLSL